MEMKIEGAYDPKLHEEQIYKGWMDSGYFNPDNLPGPRSENYIVYMPLPNVTGSLHMGHTLDNTLQDIVIRYHRMRGYKTLWFPGTDHAGIATQYVVEKQLKKEGINRFELGREKFIERVWEWKKEYGGIILSQLQKLGCSADWSRTRFTMDPDYARDVQDVFVHYFEKGLLYRGFRTVNWCTRCGTSLSELELEYKEEETKLWYIKYSDEIIVATTRPETMLGDTAIAVNPNDERFKKLIGKTVVVPIANREIPIVADEMIDKEFGTGMVKVTPAHDGVDFEIGERNKLPMIQVIDARGRMTSEAGIYEGKKTSEAREEIIRKLEEENKLVKVEPYKHNVAVCYRCNSVIEPIPSAQWFLKMRGFADSAITAVKSGNIKIHPERFEKPYFDWLSNIRDWTVSRQIWWGHRLPVWFCKNSLIEEGKESTEKDNFIVTKEKPHTCPFCKTCDMEQSSDVLDTWFSSALWPFAGMSDEDKKKYYPGNILITARDILNLWVARMIYSGIEFKKEVPFKDVLIHGTIMTKDGKRMSKSLGTGIDPLQYIEQYGADVTRFAVIWQATGQDIRWDETAVIGGKKFLNKIWNAAKFVLSNIQSMIDDSEKIEPVTEVDKKILDGLANLKQSVTADIEIFEFSKALHDIYEFFWHSFCDEYIEVAKIQMQDEKKKETTQKILFYVLKESLIMLHPFVPFITEVLWKEGIGSKTPLIIHQW
ncbi:valine--tRNA ligase [Candidatus Parcubacteria bacterium]|jgi:valyl-tRNA synthetase|nr:MAG: valine--tRNA ligase [Candidatus Parcubacteria bacterium]